MSQPTTPKENDQPRVRERRTETQRLKELLELPGPYHIYLYGPRGSGKTTVTNHVLDSVQHNTVYLSCTTADTQYKALRQICHSLTGNEPETGHHTSELKETLEDHVSNNETIIVLDEIDFLLENDGNDLLYFLSRLEAPLTTISISAHTSDISTSVDQRTYSSLQPVPLHFDQYDTGHVQTILTRKTETLPDDITIKPGTLRRIAENTANIRFGLLWLNHAVKHSNGTVTPEDVDATRTRAVRGYRDTLLQDFTPHHYLLFEAIHELSQKEDKRITAGDVYDRYDDMCQRVQRECLTHRRLSDFLTHLELLNLITVEYHHGGESGKTREIHVINHF